jgi:hypothetical protein
MRREQPGDVIAADSRPCVGASDLGPAPGGSPLPQRRPSVRLYQAFGSIWGRDFRCLDFLSPGHASDGFRDVRTLPFGFLDIQAPPGDLAIADAHDDHAAFL